MQPGDGYFCNKSLLSPGIPDGGRNRRPRQIHENVIATPLCFVETRMSAGLDFGSEIASSRAKVSRLRDKRTMAGRVVGDTQCFKIQLNLQFIQRSDNDLISTPDRAPSWKEPRRNIFSEIYPSISVLERIRITTHKQTNSVPCPKR